MCANAGISKKAIKILNDAFIILLYKKKPFFSTLVDTDVVLCNYYSKVNLYLKVQQQEESGTTNLEISNKYY